VSEPIPSSGGSTGSRDVDQPEPSPLSLAAETVDFAGFVDDPDATKLIQAPPATFDPAGVSRVDQWAATVSGESVLDRDAIAPVGIHAMFQPEPGGSQTALATGLIPSVAPSVEQLPEGLALDMGHDANGVGPVAHFGPDIASGPGPGRLRPAIVIVGALALLAACTAVYFLLSNNGSGLLGTNGGADAGSEIDASASGPGSFSEPYEFGTSVVVFYDDKVSGEERRWVIEVVTPVADATQDLVNNAAAEPPPAGEVFALARVRVTYQSGPGPAQLSDLQLNSVGSSTDKFDQASDACPAVTEPLDLAGSLNQLEAVEGNVCWRIPAEELSSLNLAVEAGPAAGTVHLSLR
jgi:hypothetical protein